MARARRARRHRNRQTASELASASLGFDASSRSVVPPPTAAPRETVTPDESSDAAQRAWRTLVQGAIVAGVLAVCTVLVTVLSSASGWDAVDWRALSFLLVQAAGTAVASYIARHVAPPA